MCIIQEHKYDPCWSTSSQYQTLMLYDKPYHIKRKNYTRWSNFIIFICFKMTWHNFCQGFFPLCQNINIKSKIYQDFNGRSVLLHHIKDIPPAVSTIHTYLSQSARLHIVYSHLRKSTQVNNKHKCLAKQNFLKTKYGHKVLQEAWIIVNWPKSSNIW